MVTDRSGFEGDGSIDSMSFQPAPSSRTPHIPRGFEHIPRHFFEGEPRLVRIIESLNLVPAHSNPEGTYLIMTPRPSSVSGVFHGPAYCYKYVVQRVGVRQQGSELLPYFSPIDATWERIMRRGLENQKTLEDLDSVQRVIRTEFVLGIPGLVELEYVQGQTWEQRYNPDNSSGLTVHGEHTHFVSLPVDAILNDAKRVYSHIVEPMLQRGYAHRDLNPTNIVFRKKDDMPVAIDMSLCVDQGEYQKDLAKNLLVGTWMYLSPEPRNFEEIDTYALGMSVLRLAFPCAPNGSLREHRDEYRAVLDSHLSAGDRKFMEVLFGYSGLEDTLEMPIPAFLTLPHPDSPTHAPVRGRAWEHEPTADHTLEVSLS